jgi:hypothetical protein
MTQIPVPGMGGLYDMSWFVGMSNRSSNWWGGGGSLTVDETRRASYIYTTAECFYCAQGGALGDSFDVKHRSCRKVNGSGGSWSTVISRSHSLTGRRAKSPDSSTRRRSCSYIPLFHSDGAFPASAFELVQFIYGPERRRPYVSCRSKELMALLLSSRAKVDGRIS